MKKLAIILLTSATLSGCASIMEGKSQNINMMTSNGDSVKADIRQGDNHAVCKYPARFDYILRSLKLKKTGY